MDYKQPKRSISNKIKMDDNCEITKKVKGGWSHVRVLFAPCGSEFGFI